jgi:hypothetical protein
MPTGAISRTIVCDGETIPAGSSAAYAASGDGVERHIIGGGATTAFAAGFTGSSGGDTSGSAVITGLAVGHGITTAHKVGVFWAGGRRVGMTVSAYTSTSITITSSSGIGTTYPSALTDVIVSPAVAIADISFDGDSCHMLVVNSDHVAAVDFQDGSGNSLVNSDITDGIIAITTANIPYAWVDTAPDAQPITGAPVAVAYCYNGSIVASELLIKMILAS